MVVHLPPVVIRKDVLIDQKSNWKQKTLLNLSLFGIFVTLVTILQNRVTHMSSKARFITGSNGNGISPVEYSSKFVTFAPFHPDQGLGNQILKFAGLFYAAWRTNREVVLFERHNAETLEKFFDLKVRTINKTCPCFLFKEENISYDSRIEEEIRSDNATASETILLDGLFQSWSYLEPVQHFLKTHMRFKKDVETFSEETLRRTVPDGWTVGKFTRVGIHNRRGNFVGEGPLEFGFTTAPESYFKRAMKYFVDRFTPVQFMVVSVDMNWSREHIIYESSSSNVNVTYIPPSSAGHDLAVLSRCDHVIVSTGTFGYLGAWFANGTTLYYKNYPRNGSYLGRKINPSNYFPPYWIPME